MGHLTLISEDVIGALEHLPPDPRLQIGQFAPQPEWDEYVTGRYKETKKKDTSLLGGGKPVVAPSMRNGAAQWKVDEADAVATSAPGRASEQTSATETKGEFKRTRSRREGSEDFGAMAMDDDDDFDDKPVEEPKAKNPLDSLPKSTFNLEDWKRAYSNKETRGAGGAIEWFYEKSVPAAAARCACI